MNEDSKRALIRRGRVCDVCRGTGADPADARMKCPHCKRCGTASPVSSVRSRAELLSALSVVRAQMPSAPMEAMVILVTMEEVLKWTLKYGNEAFGEILLDLQGGSDPATGRVN